MNRLIIVFLTLIMVSCNPHEDDFSITLLSTGFEYSQVKHHLSSDSTSHYAVQIIYRCKLKNNQDQPLNLRFNKYCYENNTLITRINQNKGFMLDGKDSIYIIYKSNVRYQVNAIDSILPFGLKMTDKMNLSIKYKEQKIAIEKDKCYTYFCRYNKGFKSL